ncbi:MAG: hypothetical protein ACYTFA_10780 [Planctomycetota bacterium]
MSSQDVELYNPDGTPSGYLVSGASHRPNPPVEHDVFDETRAVVGLDVPGVGLIGVVMTGPSSVDVYFEGTSEGDANDDDGDWLDEVTTEMKTLELHGFHPDLGDVYLRLRPGALTVGQIEELVNNLPGRLDVDPFAPGNAESFFDVFFEVEIGGSRYHNRTAARMEGIITNKPPGPGDEYVKTQVPIELFDENGEPTGWFVTEASHVPNQPVACEQSDPVICDGVCTNPAEVCTPDPGGGPCFCYLPPVPCEQSDPVVCDGVCTNPDEVCTPDPGGGPCSCEPVTCALSEFPACLGVCPPDTHCEAIPESSVILPSPDLPPESDPSDCDQIVSQYEGVDVHAMFPGGIDFSDPKHKCFQNVERMDDGNGNEIETFDSTLEGLVDMGGGPVPVALTGPVTVVALGKTGNTTGTFSTEIISMSLTGDVGGVPIEIRESPSLASTGQTTITDLGGGLYQVDSFFDVFTELSVDGGPFDPQTDGPGRMVLVPVNQGVCECVADEVPCDQSDPATCDGVCPNLDEVCTPDPLGGPCFCYLPPVPCDQSDPAICDGVCPNPDEVCTPDPEGGPCSCQPVPCDQSAYPSCAGECPSGTVCTPNTVTGVCTCEPVACELSEFPACLGVCPPDTHCEAIPESGVVLPSPDLPPESDPSDCEQIVSQYEGDGVHAMFPGGIDFSDPKHKCFQNVLREAVGDDEMETFDSTLEGLVDIGGGPVPVTLTGPVQVVAFDKAGNTTGTFSTEIISMSLTGNVGTVLIEIRESPSLASTGETTITDLGGGLHQIDSFFDVFTELSVDGGPFDPQTDGPGRVVLVTLDQGVCECVSDEVPCDQSDPAICDGVCTNPAEVCTPDPDGGPCSCQPVACEQSDPAVCDGVCPNADEVCTPDSDGGPCSCQPVTCALSEFPACLGVCPPDTHCEAIPESGVVLPSPDLPPESDPTDCAQIVSQYAGVGVHAMFPGGIDFSDPKHKCFQNVQREAVGDDEIETFDSIVEGLVDIGGGPVPVTLTGPVEVVVFGKTGNTTGTFQTEIISMSLMGDVGGLTMLIRESPSLASTGQTTITDLGGGLYQIDSFFDVFTELSTGGPFDPQTDGPGRVVLVSVDQGVCECVPDPTGACCLLGDATCIITTQAQCEDPVMGGVYQGDGTVCLGMEACCDAAGVCYMADALCCLANGNTPQGPGTVCTAPEACCFPDNTCRMLDPLCCDDEGGVPQGAGSVCLGIQACCDPGGQCYMADAACCLANGDMPGGPGSICLGMEACCDAAGVCYMADAACCLANGNTPQGPGTVCTAPEACCFPDSTCRMLDPLCCDDEGGVPQGAGSVCLGIEACCDAAGVCYMADAACCLANGNTPQGPGTVCTAPEACCFPDNTCRMLDPLCCDDEGGVPQGAGSQCLGMEACCDAADVCYMADRACCLANGNTPKGPGTDCTDPNVCGPPFNPPDLPTDPTHQVRKNRYISVNPKTNPTVDSVLKVEVAQMKRCQNAPTRGCETDSDCDSVCDDSAGAPPHYTLKCPPANCALTVPPSVCVWSGPCVDLAPTFAPPLTWVVQQPQQDPTGGCKKPGCPPYAPGETNCCTDEDWMAYLGPTVPPLTGGYTSWSDVWADLPLGLLHITDCGIVPVVTYAVYACDPDDVNECSTPLMVGTQRFPVNDRPIAFHLYADVCGGTQLPGPTVLPPDGYVSVKDLLVEQLTLINYGSTNLPQMHPTWADMHGSGTGIPPNYNLSVSDLSAVYVFSLVNGYPYVNTQGGLDPQDCP